MPLLLCFCFIFAMHPFCALRFTQEPLVFNSSVSFTLSLHSDTANNDSGYCANTMRFFCRLHMTNTREHKSSHRLKIDLQVLAGLLFSAKHIYAICCSTRHTAFVQSPLPSCLFPQSQVLEHPKSVFFINSSFRKMKLFTTWKSYFLHVRINILFLCKRSILFDCE